MARKIYCGCGKLVGTIAVGSKLQKGMTHNCKECSRPKNVFDDELNSIRKQSEFLDLFKNGFKG